MKKIVGIIAAVAMIATSVFAADISAKVELDGKLFNYDGGTKAMSALNVDKPAAQHWNAVFSASASGDNAGASFVVMSGADETFGGWNTGKELAGKNWQIWMKPTDTLKLTIGANGVNLNQEQITWSGTALKSEGDGFGINLGLDALSIDVLFLPGLAKDWFSKADGADAVVAETAVKIGYGADFGNIGFLFKGESTFKKNTIAIGYSNNFDGLFAFLNAGVILEKDKDLAIRAEVFAKGNVDSFGWAIWIPFDYAGDAAVGTILELTMGFDGFTGYLRVNDGNWLAKTFDAEFRLGAKGSVGAAGWNTWAQFNVASKSFSVPFELGYSF